MFNSSDIFRVCWQELRDAVRAGDVDSALQAATALEAVCSVPYPLLGLLGSAIGTGAAREADLLAAAGLPLWPRSVGQAPRTYPTRARTARLHALANALFAVPPPGLLDFEAEGDAAIAALRQRGTSPDLIERWSRLRQPTMLSLAYGLGGARCRCPVCHDGRELERGSAG